MKRRNVLQCISLVGVSLAGTKVLSAPTSKTLRSEFSGSSLTESSFLAASEEAIKPEKIYPLGSGDSIRIRIGNGGAGQAGLIEVLATDYVKFKGGGFAVAWYKSDTTVTLDYLKRGIVDVGLVYDGELELQAVREGYATALSFVFKDHFWIVAQQITIQLSLMRAIQQRQHSSKLQRQVLRLEILIEVLSFYHATLALRQILKSKKSFKAFL